MIILAVLGVILIMGVGIIFHSLKSAQKAHTAVNVLLLRHLAPYRR